MWKIFTLRSKVQEGSKGNNQEEEPQSHFQELKSKLEKQLRSLTKHFQGSQFILNSKYSISEVEETLTNTFNQLVTTIQGLITIVGQLKQEMQEVQAKLSDYNTTKHKLQNHQNIISDLQDSHSQLVNRIYKEKAKSQDELNAKNLVLENKKQELERELTTVMTRLSQIQEKNCQLELDKSSVINQNILLERKLTELDFKYRTFTSDFQVTDSKKVVDIQKMRIEYIFYYRKFKDSIIEFLNIRDLVHLQLTNKFFFRTLKKQQSKRSYNYFKKSYQKSLTYQMKSVKLYEKIYQLFPNQNIKINAFKYLYFRIKPATYILPYLQEEQVQMSKRDQFEQKQKQGGKFSWRSLFNTEKNKPDKKEENKFNLSTLKNEEEFKRIQIKLQATFKNILQLKMPEDLKYFSQNMEKQLQELKQDMTQSRQGKGDQLEWTSQLYCLSRYMYHQINQLYNLLQVIFGELVRKNKEVIELSQQYEYLKQNQSVLRNLIENLSTDKTNIQKKYMSIQNDILKKTLEKQAACSSQNKLQKDLQQLKQRFQKLEAQYEGNKSALTTIIEQKKQNDDKFLLIRQELENIDKIPSSSRKQSIGSIDSEENPAQ